MICVDGRHRKTKLTKVLDLGCQQKRQQNLQVTYWKYQNQVDTEI